MRKPLPDEAMDWKTMPETTVEPIKQVITQPEYVKVATLSEKTAGIKEVPLP